MSESPYGTKMDMASAIAHLEILISGNGDETGDVTEEEAWEALDFIRGKTNKISTKFIVFNPETLKKFSDEIGPAVEKAFDEALEASRKDIEKRMWIYNPFGTIVEAEENEPPD